MAQKPKQPGKIWHAWQNAKLAVKAFADKKERPKMQSVAARAGVSVLLAAASLSVATAMFPFGLIGGVVVGVAAGTVFSTAYHRFASFKQSRYAEQYLRQRMNAWHDQQRKGPVVARIKRGVQLLTKKTGIAVGFSTLAAGVAGTTCSVLAWTGVVDGASFVGKVAAAMSDMAVTYGVSASSAAAVVTGVTSVAAIVGGATFVRNKRGLKVLRGSVPANKGQNASVGRAGNDNAKLPGGANKFRSFINDYNKPAQQSTAKTPSVSPNVPKHNR